MARARILCPVDFSPGSERALRYAIDLADKLHADITVLHAWELPTYAVPDGAVVFGADVMMRVERATAMEIAAFAKRVGPGVALDTRVVQGPPAFEIPKVAAEIHADLIVMGTHGRTGLAHLFLGSVAERVVRSSRVPVLTVPPDRADRPHDPKQKAHVSG